MGHRIRLALTLTLVAITLVAFAHYLVGHRYLITQLSHTPVSTVIWLLMLYVVWFGALSLIVLASLRICKKAMGFKESFLLNAYSTFVNFFVPGQGGIALRGIYLKKTKKLAVRNYIFASLVYYAFYTIISVLFILLYNRPIWQTLGAAILVGVFSFGVIYVYKNRTKIKSTELDLTGSSFLLLFLATLLQAFIQVLIFAIELHSINKHIAFHQAIAYTGIANFALFVALTPGAIGIRESFLVLSHKLYGISSSNIIAANVIDRSVFIVFLGILFILTIGFHAKNKSVFSKPVPELNDDNKGSLQPSGD